MMKAQNHSLTWHSTTSASQCGPSTITSTGTGSGVDVSSPRTNSYLELIIEMEKTAQKQVEAELQNLLQMVPGGLSGPRNQEGANHSDPWSNDKPAFFPARAGPSNSVECRCCKSIVIKSGAQNRVTCLCGNVFCYVCSEKLPPVFSFAALSHFCLHPGSNADGACGQCHSCHLYERVDTIDQGSTVQLGETRSRCEVQHVNASSCKRKNPSRKSIESQAPRIRTRRERWVARQISDPVPVGGNTPFREGSEEDSEVQAVEAAKLLGDLPDEKTGLQLAVIPDAHDEEPTTCSGERIPQHSLQFEALEQVIDIDVGEPKHLSKRAVDDVCMGDNNAGIVEAVQAAENSGSSPSLSDISDPNSGLELLLISDAHGNEPAACYGERVPQHSLQFEVVQQELEIETQEPNHLSEMTVGDTNKTWNHACNMQAAETPKPFTCWAWRIAQHYFQYLEALEQPELVLRCNQDHLSMSQITGESEKKNSNISKPLSENTPGPTKPCSLGPERSEMEVDGPSVDDEDPMSWLRDLEAWEVSCDGFLQEEKGPSGEE